MNLHLLTELKPISLYYMILKVIVANNIIMVYNIDN